MKIPFTALHYKPTYAVSFDKENFGDSVKVGKNTFKNIILVKSNLYKEIGSTFTGKVNKDRHIVPNNILDDYVDVYYIGKSCEC